MWWERQWGFTLLIIWGSDWLAIWFRTGETCQRLNLLLAPTACTCCPALSSTDCMHVIMTVVIYSVEALALVWTQCWWWLNFTDFRTFLSLIPDFDFDLIICMSQNLVTVYYYLLKRLYIAPVWQCPKCLWVKHGLLHIFLIRYTQSSQPGRDDALSLVAVAVRGPAGSAVGLTCQHDCGGGQWPLQDLQTRPPLGDKGKSTYAKAAGKSGCGGPAEGQLTVLSHSGHEVRKQTSQSNVVL